MTALLSLFLPRTGTGGRFGNGSHMSNITKVLTAASKDIVNFSVPGWPPTPANVEKLAGSIAAMKITESDTVILDLCSNCAYMGTSNL